jgi:polyribonucleotide nucleotidyltransferase
MEKFASAGRIPGSFKRREGQLGDHEILTSRLVDRALRPMFPDDYHADIQVNIWMISADPQVMPDALAGLAAGAALAVTDIPFNGPISEVRVALVDGEYVINPKLDDQKRATLDLIVAGSIENILMVEGEMSEVSEKEMLDAIIEAHKAIIVQCQALQELTIAVGKTEKRTYVHESHNEELRSRVYEGLYKGYHAVASQGLPSKTDRKAGLKLVFDEFMLTFGEHELTDEIKGLIKAYAKGVEKKAMRDAVLDTRVRLDGRATDQIRPIYCEVDLLPGPHGSALFTRGETQSLTTVTLGTKLDEQIVDQALYQGYGKFMLHYNFPGFSTGEVKPNRAPARREVGHGNLAFRALKKVMPDEAENPYTIRIVSDILESNGSSSMATVCAGTMALMDAGINIKAPVSGIAMGLITDTETGRFAILSDILGDEDHLGDMDFKVTGTEKGITACQMDLKVDGLPYEVLEEALEQARRGRLHILGKINEAIPAVRPEMKPQAPRSVKIFIEREFIGAVIGPGGKVVQQIQRETGAVVNIEEVNNQGIVSIFAANGDDMKRAEAWVRGIVAVPNVGDTYVGTVKTIQPFGAFIEFMPGKEGLLHISEIKHERLPSMDGVLELGEEIKVKLLEVDKKTGKYRLSRKALLPRPTGEEAEA